MKQLYITPSRTEIKPGIIRYHEPNNLDRVTYKDVANNRAIQIEIPTKYIPVPISSLALLLGEEQRYTEILDEKQFNHEEEKALFFLDNSPSGE